MPSSRPAGSGCPDLESGGESGPHRNPRQQFPVVAVGASAGGLEAFSELLRHLPADSGMAFVFIQHLAPGHESMLAQLLSRETTMPVTQVEDGTVLSPNRVYVIPPNVCMTISGLVLALKPRETAGTTIDPFLRSLAESCKGASIAVILSGTGSDGALGVQAIAEEGGIVFAEDPISAKFVGMPRSAIATGYVDFVLPPERIAAELTRIAREPRLLQSDTPAFPGQFSEQESGFQALFELLRARTGIDFSLYRRTTVRRRVLRRLALLRQGSLEDYLDHAKKNPDELHALTQDILIRVTHFFRNPEAFEVLRQRVFPALIRKAPPDHAVRIWIPGCSTGEEAYSVAISFLEVAEHLHSRVPVQVFATDINEAAIERARRGTYIDNIAADVSPERLKRFFVRAGREFHVSRELRDLCIFSGHDLLNDPPFSHMDLVSCRNVLIYLDAMHEHALSRFHFALNPGGFLLLGRSETANACPGLFAPLDNEARLYVRQESAGHAPLTRASRTKSAVPRPLSAADWPVAPPPLEPDPQEIPNAFEDEAGPDADYKPGDAVLPEDRRKFEMHIHSLEKELASAKAHLKAVILEQESINEEVVSSNEELQSLNEELESSTEELEATNEELTTVNQELQVRNTELEMARKFAQATIDTVRGSLLVLGADLRVLRANGTFYRIFRTSPAEVEHRFIFEVGDGRWNDSRLRQLLEQILPTSQTIEDFEMTYEVPSMGQRILLLNAHRFELEERILLAIEDVTESRRVEEELRQSRKMEAIGFLAAGVAHDFNNLLTGIIGNASLLLDAMPEKDPGRAALGRVISGGERAAELTRQLLAYAGKGRFYLERLNLSEVVIQTGKLVHLSIPSSVQLRLDLDKHLPLLLADPGQIQQVVMNLIINAAESIGSAGGTVLVRTGQQTVTGEPLPDLYPNEKVTPGEYVFLEVVDNGSGMDQQTMRLIFDPFFTTKFTGRGLGLSAVLGIVRQHHGALQLRSVPGQGSSFRVLFRATEEGPSHAAGRLAPDELSGAGTVLVVDDEEIITTFTRSALEAYGYTVLLAQDGQEGVRLFRERSSDIRLVLLDVAMPGMDGLATLEQIRGIRPDVPVIVCSGFGDVDVEARFAGKNVAAFCPKPFTVKQLARKVKDCMPAAEAGDGPGTARAGN